MAWSGRAPYPTDRRTRDSAAQDAEGGAALATSDRQRDLLSVVSRLDDPGSEFSVQEIVELARQLPVKGFSPSHASQILAALINSGIVFRNRRGKYFFAVPLLGDFIRRQYPDEQPELIDEASR